MFVLRLTDIIELKEELSKSNGLVLTDKVRLFKGDSPERQFETGQIYTCLQSFNIQFTGWGQ